MILGKNHKGLKTQRYDQFTKGATHELRRITEEVPRVLSQQIAQGGRQYFWQRRSQRTQQGQTCQDAREISEQKRQTTEAHAKHEPPHEQTPQDFGSDEPRSDPRRDFANDSRRTRRHSEETEEQKQETHQCRAPNETESAETFRFG